MFRPRSRQGTTWPGALLTVLALAAAVRGADLSGYYGFGSMEILKLDWELGPPLAADLNGDSLGDLVVCNNRKARIELLLQKRDFDPQAAETISTPTEENVNDLFGRETAWRFKRFGYPLRVKATSVALGDFNHDGQPDLAYYSAEGLDVVLQDRASTDAVAALSEPRWRAPLRFDLRDGLKSSQALAAGDINHDGRTDLAVLLRDGYYILLQTADGRMAQPVRHYSSSGNLRQIEIGDLDGDGRCDLLLLTAEHEEYPLRVRRQNSDGSLGPEQRYHIPVPSVLRLCPPLGGGRHVVASVSAQSGRLSVHTRIEQEQQADTVFVHPLPSDDAADKRDVTGADVDGDGRADLVVTDPGRGQFIVLRRQRDRGWGPAAVFPGLKDMRKVCAVRLDESARETLAVLSIDEKLIGLSRFDQGRLGFPRTVAVVGEPQAMAAADLNGDGEMDLAYVAGSPGQRAGGYSLHTILSLGRATARAGSSLELTDVEDRPQDLLAADIDHDGDMDLIVVRSYDPLLLVRQTQDGAFEQQAKTQAHLGLVGNLTARAVSVAPLGPDRQAALLMARGDFARAVSFDADKGWQVIDQYQAGDRRRRFHVTAAVPGAEGRKPDIVAYDDVSGIVFFVEAQADGTYRAGREIKVGTAAVRKILISPSGAEATPDLILCGERKLICMRTGPKVELRQVAGFEPNIEKGRFGHFTIADINSDDVPDVIVCEQYRHHVQILAFDEKGGIVDACKFKVFETHPHTEKRRPGSGPSSGEPRHVLVEDVTGDGRNDLVLLVHDRLIVYPQD
ncbi:MAG: VCBS repeat-containing protein [Phycisphaerae bacterium]|nr:VCBS repeat-containing protein [Phycisphaerae bacterium]